MVKLKMLFGLSLAMAVVSVVAAAPSPTLGRFVLPEGCCKARVESGGSMCNACLNDSCENLLMEGAAH